VNLIPFLSGKNTAAPHDTLCWRFWEQAAIREGKWKYISGGKDAELLFDLSSDEHETKNLIASDPKRAAAMREKLETWTQQFQPPGIPNAPLNDQETAWFNHYFKKL
jgi:arylsulfatase A-like enzyme